MSIRKTPICPFCHSEMKRERVRPDTYGDAEIIVRIDISNDLLEKLKHTISLSMYECSECGFVAFWRGEPQ